MQIKTLRVFIHTYFQNNTMSKTIAKNVRFKAFLNFLAV